MKRVETKSHRHPEIQVFYLESGLMRIRAANGVWVVPPKHLAVVNKNIAHSASTLSESAGWYVYLPSGMVEKKDFSIATLEANSLLVSLLERVVSQKNLNRRKKTDAAMKVLISSELREAKEQSMGLPFPSSSNLMKIAEGIRWGVNPKRPMCEWAEEAGMSLRSLARHFKKETGINLENWRRSALHQRAIELISKNRSVSDVALELGYESVSAFVYSFRNEYGLPPMQFLRSKKII